MKFKLIVFSITVALSFWSCGDEKEEKEITMLKEKIAQFAPVDVKYDHSILDERQKKVIEKLYAASQIMDEIFLDQVYSKNYEIRDRLKGSNLPKDQLTYEYFRIMFGPFDRLDHDKTFYGDETKPEGANFYPEDMTKEEFNNWINDNPDQEPAFKSEFTVIRRENGALKAIPYSEYYKEKLSSAANLLREAAEFAENASLKNYLNKRADAFESNDYFESDKAWMDLKNHDIEAVIGPYEVYEDELFNYKASFESFVTIKDPVESEKLAKFANYLDDIEKNLPYDDKFKNFDRGSESPIVVSQLVFSAGDTKAGVQTLAFNLPNDERVRKEKGSKKVMLKNIHEAKFNKLLYPIAQMVLSTEQLQNVTFEAFFNHTLMHEISHGVGPGYIKVNGRDTEVKQELKETYSKIEECKADVLGMYNNIYMINKGVYPENFEGEIYATFLAGIFRSVRFGINEAHGAANAIIYNYLLERGAYVFDEKESRVAVNYPKMYEAIKDLAARVLTIQATGDYEGAKNLIDVYAVNSNSMKILREKLSALPVDIKPIFEIEKEMAQ